MITFIRDTNWLEHKQVLTDILQQGDSLTTYTLDQGLEAEVLKISSDQEDYVLKTWNKSSKPDVQFQYRLLDALSERGVAVSKPVGWGIDPNGDKVLLTSFDGIPMLIQAINNKKIEDLASILAQIHQVPVDKLEHIPLPKFDFIEYFFTEASEQPDLHHAVTSLREQIPIKQDCLIHGDFHLGNVVEQQERYVIIDWTNGQLGDARYDFGWTLILIEIYAPESYAEAFQSAYLAHNYMKQEELEGFKAWAYLRWILLSRRGSTPIGPNTLDRVAELIANNQLLKSFKFNL